MSILLFFRGATHSYGLTDTGLSISDSISPVRYHNRAITDTGLSISDSLTKGKFLVSTGLSISDSLSRFYTPGAGSYQITIRVPYGSGTFITGQLIDLLGKITPAHLLVTIGYNNGFLVGISLVGIDAI